MTRRRGLTLKLAAALAALGVAASALPASAAVTSKLPDLAVLAPFEFRIEKTASGKKRLRFTTVVVNIGAGPFQLYGYDEDGEAMIGDDLLVRQQVLQSDGTFTERDTSATMFWSGDGHNHFHVQGLQLVKIQNMNAVPLRNAKKLGFCFLDSYGYGSTKPSAYNSANHVCVPAPDGRVPMGISVRWGDVYRATIAYQWIDITGLPNGDYKVKVVADPPYRSGGKFSEGNETNNRGWTKIRIKGTSVTVLSRSARP